VSSSVLLIHGLSSELLSNHVSENAHHSSTAVVELSIELAGLLLGVLDVGSEESNPVVSIILASRPPGELNKTTDSNNLGKSGSRDGEKAIDASGDVAELKVVAGGDVSIIDDVVVVDNASNNGHHGNASVLTLNGTATLKGLRLAGHPSEGIEHAEGLGGSELELVDHLHRSGRGRRNRGIERTGSSKGGGKDSELHFV